MITRGIPSVFQRLLLDARTADHLGLQLSGKPRLGGGALYIEIPVEQILSLESGEASEGRVNQVIKVVPACSLELKDNSVVLIEPNKEFNRFGYTQGSYLVSGADRLGRLIPSFIVHLRKQLKLDEISYGIRIYKFDQ